MTNTAHHPALMGATGTPTANQSGARVNPDAYAEAKDFLHLFLEQDYGSDWDRWQAGVEQWLKAHPD